MKKTYKRVGQEKNVVKIIEVPIVTFPIWYYDKTAPQPPKNRRILDLNIKDLWLFLSIPSLFTQSSAVYF